MIFTRHKTKRVLREGPSPNTQEIAMTT